ncbi:1315_t:CDS:1, partial [Dentiscutata heterogama]
KMNDEVEISFNIMQASSNILINTNNREDKVTKTITGIYENAVFIKVYPNKKCEFIRNVKQNEDISKYTILCYGFKVSKSLSEKLQQSVEKYWDRGDNFLY